MNAVTEANAVTDMPDPLVFSDNAANKVRELIEEEGNPGLKLRVFVTGVAGAPGAVAGSRARRSRSSASLNSRGSGSLAMSSAVAMSRSTCKPAATPSAR